MTLEINDPEAVALARELARITGDTVPQAVVAALRERVARERGRQAVLAQTLVRIGKECAALPVVDDRPADQTIGYDEDGLSYL